MHRWLAVYRGSIYISPDSLWIPFALSDCAPGMNIRQVQSVSSEFAKSLSTPAEVSILRSFCDGDPFMPRWRCH